MWGEMTHQHVWNLRAKLMHRCCSCWLWSYARWWPVLLALRLLCMAHMKTNRTRTQVHMYIHTHTEHRLAQINTHGHNTLPIKMNAYQIKHHKQREGLTDALQNMVIVGVF